MLLLNTPTLFPLSLLLFLLFTTISLFLFHYLTHLSITVTTSFFFNTINYLPITLHSDAVSSLFSIIVILISITVLLFSEYYFYPSYPNFSYFVPITLSFILSMLLLIHLYDLLSLMVAWDGLGLSSFFLITFYMTPTTTSSSIYTLYLNRVGDSLLILSIILTLFVSPSLLYTNVIPISFPIILITIYALFTKSAIFPFSPWLPVAIAAPTPISSLVHSSTLVTAGIYVLVRNYHFLSFHPSLIAVLTLSGIYTTLYAGISSLAEPDIKNLVALSTLSHLGIMATSLGIGYPSLAFAHLISHALFKSTLFLSIGSSIINTSHSQDSRTITSTMTFQPLTSSILTVSSYNLLSFPFLSGFYSNDTILESIPFSPLLTIFTSSVVNLNILFTFYYTLRIFFSIILPPHRNPFILVNISPLPFSVTLVALSSFSIPLILFLNTLSIGSLYATTPLFVKYTPFALMLLSLIVFLYPSVFQFHPNISTPLLTPIFTSIIFLYDLYSSTITSLLPSTYNQTKSTNQFLYFTITSLPLEYITLGSRYLIFSLFTSLHNAGLFGVIFILFLISLSLL